MHISGNQELELLRDQHLEWLGGFDTRHQSLWRTLLNSDPEAAMGEADVVRRIRESNYQVEPGESLTSDSSTDLAVTLDCCRLRVEVTCIRSDTLDENYITDLGDNVYGWKKSLVHAVKNKVSGKVRQATTAGIPVVVAVGTWHSLGSMKLTLETNVAELLVGDHRLSWTVNPKTGESTPPNLSTSLYSAIFNKADEDGTVSDVRQPISGVLLCPFNNPYRAPVLLRNPNAQLPLPPTALVRFKSATLVHDAARNTVAVQWVESQQV